MKLAVQLFSIALQSVVTYYYFTYFGLTWFSVIPFFTMVALVKLNFNPENK